VVEESRLLSFAEGVAGSILPRAPSGAGVSSLSFHKERIPPFTAGVNPTLADQSTDDTLAGYSTVIDIIK
jgi:hypothetical protein